MKKITKILAGITALVMSLSIAGCSANTTDYPSFKPGDGTTNVETSEKYTVNVRSAGGMKLNGVRVTAYNSQGVKVRSGISQDGEINFNLSLGNYTLKVDEETLPAGYYVEEGATYVTNPEKREEIDISIPSKVISQAAASDKLYSLGEIMNDFTLKDYRENDEGYTGTKSYKLSEILSRKKAVVLNFWYPTCTYCTQEFPYLQSAYAEAKSDVEVIGVCFASYTNANVANYVESHKEDFKLTFPLCVDTAGLQKKFSISSAPTTIVIDRYGMIAFQESGGQPTVAFWQNLFKKYASDDYVQDIEGTGGDSGDNGSSSQIEKPDVTMPASDQMAASATATGLKATFRADIEDEYAWPWTTGSDEKYTYITVTNTGKQNSYSTLYVDIELKKDDMLSFDYYISSESGRDSLYVFLDGQLINGSGWSGIENTWTSYDAYVADRDKTVELAFIYHKDDGDPGADKIGDDCAKIKNIRTSKVEDSTSALDVIREAASGAISEGKYSHYVTPVLGDDGFYHVDSKDGPLLYISITNITPWSELHATDNKFEHDGASDYASLYLMTYFKYSKTIEDKENNVVLSFTVNMDGKDFATPVQQYNHLLLMLEEPYELMPVSRQLKEWAEAFTAQYAKDNNATSHDNEWLEFCFYYDHYGAEHTGEAGDVCLRNTDITKGLTIYNTLDIGFETTPDDGDNIGITTGNVNYALGRHNGLYYEFTAPKDGIYQIRDYTGKCQGLSVFTIEEDGLTANNIDFCNDVLDFDAIPVDGELTGKTIYNTFNHYMELSAGETVYLLLFIEEKTTGSFTFDIIYHESVDKLMTCSTGGGAWIYDEFGTFIYNGITAAYDSTTDRYYYAKADGSPDYTRPVYISMIHSSYFMSEMNGWNYSSVQTLIEGGKFAEKVDAASQATMVEYLKKSTEGKDKDDELYGFVEADSTIVNILNNLIANSSKNSGGAGDSRGWMCFAAYMEHLTYSK